MGILELPRQAARVVGARRRTGQFVRRVPTENGHAVLTIGDLAYAGYQVPAGLLNPDSVVLSAGAGLDVSFESMLVDRYGCRVHVLDPVPEAAVHVAEALAHEPRITFEQAALWSSDTELQFHVPVIDGFVSHSATDMHGTPVAFVARARSVGSLRDEHGWERIDLLKISAEGAEFAILERVLDDAEPISAICVEFAQPVAISRVEAVVRRLGDAGYVPVARYARPFNWKMTFVRR